MIRRLTSAVARKEFAEILNRAHYAHEVTVVTKHGKDIAAVVPINQIPSPSAPPSKKPPKHAD